MEIPANRAPLPAGSTREQLMARLNRAISNARPIAIGADRVYADSADRWLAALSWKLGLAARGERALIERTVQPGMVVADVGANIGLRTLLLARRVGPSGRAYAVEPEARNFRLLSRAVSEAGLAQVELRQVAAADLPGWMTLYLSAVDGGDHRIFPADEERALATVRAVCLDDVLEDEARVDFIRLDVQGGEVSVLRGLRRTLARHAELRLLCAVAPELLRRGGAGAAALFDPLCEAGYVPHLLSSSGVTRPVHPTMAWSTARAAGRVDLYFSRSPSPARKP